MGWEQKLNVQRYLGKSGAADASSHILICQVSWARLFCSDFISQHIQVFLHAAFTMSLLPPRSCYIFCEIYNKC